VGQLVRESPIEGQSNQSETGEWHLDTLA